MSSGPKLAAFLDDHLADVGSRTDCFRQRLRQMTERITELERERTAALAYMEAVNHRGSLSLAVRAKVEKVPETAIPTRLDLKSLSYAVKCS